VDPDLIGSVSRAVECAFDDCDCSSDCLVNTFQAVVNAFVILEAAIEPLGSATALIQPLQKGIALENC
jgi:hypothetical protein